MTAWCYYRLRSAASRRHGFAAFAAARAQGGAGATACQESPKHGVAPLERIHCREDGSVLLKHACKLGLEGIVSKLADAPYRSGRGHDWLKTKCSDRQELVIAGFDALDRGRACDRRAGRSAITTTASLRYAGRTGTGFTHKVARDLYRKLKSLRMTRRRSRPCRTKNAARASPIWVEPKLVAEVDFHGWTHGDAGAPILVPGRCARTSRPRRWCARSRQWPPASRDRRCGAARRSKRPPLSQQTSETNAGQRCRRHAVPSRPRLLGRRRRHQAEPRRILRRRSGPGCARTSPGRPISLVRCPDGAAGQCFFQKHVSAGISPEHLHQVAEKGDKIISIDDLAGLVSLVQGGVLEVHTRGSTDRASRQGRPAGVRPRSRPRHRLEGCGRGRARRARAPRGHQAQDAWSKRPAAKACTWCCRSSRRRGTRPRTSAAPSPRRWRRTHPTATSPARPRSKRNKRIFIDYLRNSREATAVAPYSTRARPGAPVSVPVDWSELGALKGANQFTVLNLPARLRRLRNDPWAGIGRIKQPLPKFK